MAVFQHPLWGYELSYPDKWVHVTQGAIDTFTALPKALAPDYDGPDSGQIMVRCEWNCARQPIEPLWNNHVGMLAGWLGARKVGAAPWHMGGASGVEAEIVLAAKDPRRLWTGILEHGLTVLHFIVLHLKEERDRFEPLATQIISSLRFPPQVEGVRRGPEGLPLPPDYEPVAPQDVIEDIARPDDWRAYDGRSGVDALQAFYVREAPHAGWEVTEYVPFPSPTDLGFARLRLERDGRTVMLGLMPYRDDDEQATLARLVFKLA